MAFIEQALNDYVEKKVVEEAIYTLRIEDATVKDDQSGLMVRLSIEGAENAKTVFHNISFVAATDDENTKNFKLGFQTAFLDLFSIPHVGNGYETDDFFGASGECKLIQEVYEGVTSNKIKLNI